MGPAPDDLYGAEVTLDGASLPPMGEALEIELEDGGIELDFDPMAQEAPTEVEFGANLAEYIDEQELGGMSRGLISLYQKDLDARSEWEETYKDGLDLLGLTVEERTEPWVGACGITHPLLSEAVVRFQSQAIGEMFPAAGPVRTKVVGKESPERIRQGDRVRNHMNYVVTERMLEYREECDKMLFTLPLAGSAFKKVYHDPALGRPVSEYVAAEDIVVGSGTKSMHSCRRLTHKMNIDPNEVRKLQASGFYRHVDVHEDPPDISEIEEKKEEIVGVEGRYEDGELITLLEIHCDLDIPGFEDHLDGEPTGIALPYVVTIDKSRAKVLAIRRNWLEQDENKEKRTHFVHYQYIPGIGFYGLGLIHLIGGIAKGSTSILRQLVDAGTLSNLPGGYKSRGLRVKGDQTPIAAGEWRDVDVPNGKISDNLFPMPYGEPSVVLAELLKSIVEEGRRFASLTDVNISSMNNEAPVGTTLALLERNLKVMTAISARIHNSAKAEFKLIASIVSDIDTEYPYEMNDPNASLQEDFDGRIDIIPVSDPNSSTMAQRIMTMQTAIQLSERAPGVYRHPEILHRRMLQALEIQDVEEIIPSEDDIKMLDPVTENQNIVNMIPVKAYATQDHQAHIQVHMLGMQDPKIMQVLEQAPNAQAIHGAGMAHVTEHLAYEYRNQIEQSLGITLPPEGEELPPEIESELSKLIAQAAGQLFNRNTVEIASIETQRQLEDPVVQDQLHNTRIKEMRAQTEALKTANDAELRMAELIQKHESENDDREQRLQIDTERIQAQLLGNILRAASQTEQIESSESIKIAEFIMQQVEKEEDGVREKLEQELSTTGDSLQALLKKFGNSQGE
jgi:hypothetical protein